MWFVVLSFLVAVLYWFLVATRHSKNFPPGPRLTLPIIGDGLALGSDINEGFKKLRLKYGDIYGFWMGPQRTVVINDHDTILEVSNFDAIVDRPEFEVPARIRGGWNKMTPGLIFTNGSNWVEQRRFTLQNLRNMGFGKVGMEEIIEEDVKTLCQHFEKTKCQPVNPRNEFQVAILRALWQIISSETLEYNDPRLVKIFQLLQANTEQSSKFLVLFSFFYAPVGRIVAKYKLAKAYLVLDELFSFIQEKIDEHTQSYQEDNMRDFMDLYLREMKTGNKESFSGEKGKANFRNVVFDLFLAGSETTSTTLNWCMLFMAKYPDIQAKVHEEIDLVTGRSRHLQIEDKNDTPYLEATIHEVQRLGNVVGLGVVHCARSDFKINSFLVPKGTQIFLNYGGDSRNPNYFPNPEVFDPTRYLTEDGKKFEPNSRITPFGLGKRRCLGETLARTELYLFFGGLMSQFKVIPAHPDDILDLEPAIGGVMAPKPYQVRFQPRL